MSRIVDSLLFSGCAQSSDQEIRRQGEEANQQLRTLGRHLAGHGWAGGAAGSARGAGFGRVEPRRRARAFGYGLLADLPRKNCWALTEHAGDPSPDGMQHLLTRAVWDHDGVRDDIRTPMSSSTSVIRERCWLLTRPVISRRAASRWKCSASTRAPRWPHRERSGRGLSGPCQ